VACRRIVPEGERCPHCGAALPRLGPPPRRAGLLELVRRKVLEVRSGDVSPSEFEAWLEGFRARFQELRAQVADECIPAEMRAEMAEELRAGRRGLEVFLQSLDLFRQWVRENDRSALDQGMALVAQAVAHLNDAIEMNWRSFRTYQESAEEYLKQLGVVTE
jgi:hypothetical protein